MPRESTDSPQHWWGAFRTPHSIRNSIGMSEVLNGEAQWRGDGHPLINHEITTATGRAAVIKGVRQAPGGTGLQFLLVFSDQDYIVMDENTLRMAIHTRQVAPAQASAVDPSRGQDGAPAASAAMHPPSAGDLLARVKPEPPPLPEATPQVRYVIITPSSDSHLRTGEVLTPAYRVTRSRRAVRTVR